jgi:hypothetical protein
MRTEERPIKDPTRTYTQTDAAKLCGVTQRTLVDRPGKIGYLTKLFRCFPGRHFSSVAVGSIKNQSELRLTVKGVEELRDLIQGISPEPPLLDESRNLTFDENGKVVKRRQSPISLNQYCEFVWFREGIDGSLELKRWEQQESIPSNEAIEAAFVEAEQIESGAIVSIEHTVEPIETAFELLEQIDSNFWEEVERRAAVGYKQGVLLKSVELKARAKGESDHERQYNERAKNVASRKRTG